MALMPLTSLKPLRQPRKVVRAMSHQISTMVVPSSKGRGVMGAKVERYIVYMGYDTVQITLPYTAFTANYPTHHLQWYPYLF